MATKLDIINLATVDMGGKSVADLTSTQYARDASLAYDQERARLLRAKPWVWLRTITELTSVAINTAAPWPYSAAIPAPCVRLWRVLDTMDEPINYELGADRSLYSNYAKVRITYSLDTAEASWPTWFADLMTAAMRVRLAMPLTESRSLANDMKAEFVDLLSQYAAIEAAEQISPEVGAPSSFLSVRG